MTTNTFTINIFGNTMWIRKWACSLFVNLIILYTCDASILVNLQTVINGTETIKSNFPEWWALSASSRWCICFTSDYETSLIFLIKRISFFTRYTFSLIVIDASRCFSNTFPIYFIISKRLLATSTVILIILFATFLIFLAIVFTIDKITWRTSNTYSFI